MCPRGGSRAKERERGHGGWASDAEVETATLKKFVSAAPRGFLKKATTRAERRAHTRDPRALTVDMGKKSKRHVSTPTPFKGQIPAFITVAEQLPEVFRAHVVSKLSLADALSLSPR